MPTMPYRNILTETKTFELQKYLKTYSFVVVTLKHRQYYIACYSILKERSK